MHVGKVTKNNWVYQDMHRALYDVKLGVAAGKKLAVKKNKSITQGFGYGAVSVYRNLKSSGNIFPAIVSSAFFILPFFGAQPLGFILGKGIQRYIKLNTLNSNLKNIQSKSKLLFRRKVL